MSAPFTMPTNDPRDPRDPRTERIPMFRSSTDGPSESTWAPDRDPRYVPQTDPAAYPRYIPDQPGSDEYVYAEMPDGTVRAVPRNQVRRPTSTQDPSAVIPPVTEEVAEYYVHLADGSVERVKETDLPPKAGTNAVHGFWQREGFVYDVIGVYPVECAAKGEKV